ncbi:hypothetical protein Sviol_43770 [Streptomyces violascens]|uniref:Uncharacterized protein n=1 Tax=Streptomyces violascens TaxID=67381 RepID=A0ABQ3QRT4_9ACTN|nr:hypothetical protein Sviol_43770 [Streptomyces violascens]
MVLAVHGDPFTVLPGNDGPLLTLDVLRPGSQAPRERLPAPEPTPRLAPAVGAVLRSRLDPRLPEPRALFVVEAVPVVLLGGEPAFEVVTVPCHTGHDLRELRPRVQERVEPDVAGLSVDRPPQCGRIRVGIARGELRRSPLGAIGVLAEPAGAAAVGGTTARPACRARWRGAARVPASAK